MGKNKTLIGGSRPLFGINEVVYARESAIRGFVEPFVIAKIRFDSALRAYKYRYLKNRTVSDVVFEDGKVATVRPVISEEELAPIELDESEIITICDALAIQVDFLDRQLVEAQEEFQRVCDGLVDDIPLPQQSEVSSQFIVSPPTPRFRVNEVVYLRETAEAVGRLEKMRVDSYHFDEIRQEWVYSFVFEQKPGENMTVGDRIDLRAPVLIMKFERELITVCEAIPLRITFLESVSRDSSAAFDRICEEA